VTVGEKTAERQVVGATRELIQDTSSFFSLLSNLSVFLDEEAPRAFRGTIPALG